MKLALAFAALLASTALAHAADTVTVTLAAPVTAAIPSVPVYATMDAKALGSFVVTSASPQTFSFSGSWPTTAPHRFGVKLTKYSGVNLTVGGAKLDGSALLAPTKPTMGKVDWSYVNFPAVIAPVGPIAPSAPIVTPVAATTHDVLIGGYPGFTGLTMANTAGLQATGRGGLYLHNSAVNGDVTNNAQVRGVITALAPKLGVFEDEAGTNGFFVGNNLWKLYVAPAGQVPDSIILNCGSSTDIAAGTGLATFRNWVTQVRTLFPHITVSPVVTPGGNDGNLGTDYGTGAHWANQRALVDKI